MSDYNPIGYFQQVQTNNPQFAYGSETAEIAVIAQVLQAGKETGAGSLPLTNILMESLYGYALDEKALQMAIKLGLTNQLPAMTHHTGPAVSQTLATDPSFRASYVLQAAKRLSGQVQSTMDKSMKDRVSDEKRFFVAHTQMQAKRIEAARRIDRLVLETGKTTFLWHTTVDHRTIPECAAANGTRFEADQMPSIGFPGAVHQYCRCIPVSVSATALDRATPIETALQTVVTG
jgi:SPP1 gp7 family putative phage head morphogenesis protein